MSNSSRATCGDCIYFAGEKLSIGTECTNINKEFRSDTARYKNRGTFACKLFVPQVNVPTRSVEKDETLDIVTMSDIVDIIERYAMQLDTENGVDSFVCNKLCKHYKDTHSAACATCKRNYNDNFEV